MLKYKKNIYIYFFKYIKMESTTINNDINAIKEVRELFNELRSNLSREEINRIRKELYKKEAVYNFSKEKYSLTNKEKNTLKNISKYFKELHNDLKKLQKYQDNITYGLDYLKDLIDDHKAKGEWKIQLSMQIISVSFTDAN